MKFDWPPLRKMTLLFLFAGAIVLAPVCRAANSDTSTNTYSCLSQGKKYTFVVNSQFFQHNTSWNGNGPVPLSITDAISSARKGLHNIWNPPGEWTTEEVTLRNFGVQDEEKWYYVVKFNLDPKKYDVFGISLPLQIAVNLKGDYLRPSRVSKISTFEDTH